MFQEILQDGLSVEEHITWGIVHMQHLRKEKDYTDNMDWIPDQDQTETETTTTGTNKEGQHSGPLQRAEEETTKQMQLWDHQHHQYHQHPQSTLHQQMQQ